MKKRILLSVATLMATVFATMAEDYQVYFDNGAVQVSDENKDNLTSLLADAGLLTAGSVTFSADGSTRKLTLNGAKLKSLNGSWYTTLSVGEDLMLELVGENEIVFNVDRSWGYALYCSSDTRVTLTGSGSLTCTSILGALHIGTYLRENATLVIDGNATLITKGTSGGIYGENGAKLVVNYGTLKASCRDEWGRADIEVRGGIQLAEGVSITQPAGAKVSDGGMFVVNADDSDIPTNVEVVITGGSASGIDVTTVAGPDAAVRCDLTGRRVDGRHRGIVVEDGHKRVVR